MAAPDEPRPPLGGLDRRAFLVRLAASAAAGAVAAYLPAWAERPRLLALRPPPPRPLGTVWIRGFGYGIAPPVAFHDDGLPQLPGALSAAVLEMLGGAEAACFGPGVLDGRSHVAEITFDGWVTYTCDLQAETPGAFNPLALPALVPFADAPPPPRLAAAIAAYRGGPEGTRLVQPSGLVLANVWMWGPGPAGAAGAVARAEPAAALFERTYGPGAPWAADVSPRGPTVTRAD
jgi:hypothetical protein